MANKYTAEFKREAQVLRAVLHAPAADVTLLRMPFLRHAGIGGKCCLIIGDIEFVEHAKRLRDIYAFEKAFAIIETRAGNEQLFAESTQSI